MTAPSLDIVIFFVMAVVVAVGIQLYRARRAARSERTGPHDLLMKRAQAHADGSAFLAKACKEYRANRHLSARQVEAVETALERLERKKAQ
ncbi:MAG: hypothetical protein J0J01_18720 [Reyranella sp.]|uniref:hypothetical protein n=1 Tax=Reyranella sp. TaxID=1929291 RepID=UPI001ACCDD1D|nr:hypothetical protein [Reyranella sp.]MBN9088945.1 hypothetical protein [Reyranella sp.]